MPKVIEKVQARKIAERAWIDLRKAILERDAYRCRVCKHRGEASLDVHHYKPRSRGGEECSENLLALCRGCHQLVTTYRLVLVAETTAGCDGPINVEHGIA